MNKSTRNYILVVAALLILLLLLRFTGVADYGAINSQSQSAAAAKEAVTDEEPVAAEESGAAKDAADAKDAAEETVSAPVPAAEASYTFRTPELRLSHFTKHGIDMGFTTEEAYEEAASRVISNPNALHKTEAEDGDDVYYIEDTNEFVVLSTDGYIRTYFNPDNGKAYFDRQ
ncbi:MAG: hypothetical protein J6O71_06030 [Lachnospiraceae bacterium]|nr:hypothetical protein [Lachnospiraceae bacterium]